MLPSTHTHILIEGGGREGVEEREGEGRKRENMGRGGRENENENRYLSVLTPEDLLIESILFLILVIS